jgi:hypothetical protein
MAYDDRFERDRDHDRDRNRDRDRERGYGGERARERGPEWRGDPAFGGGWGNQTVRPHRLGDRNWSGPRDDPYAEAPRYGSGGAEGYGSGYGAAIEPDSFFGAPGVDAEFAGPRFDRLDVGSIGTHGVHPVSSAYGADYRGMFGATGGGGGWLSSARRYAEIERHRDPHYDQWRRRQVEQLDRDYDDYRREPQAQFDREFGAWRERRGQQRQAIGRVTEHMEVIGADDTHVGTVDCTRGDRIILTRSDPSAGGIHHAIPCGWVDSVDDKVRLNLKADDAKARWREEERSGALFEREARGEPGPHILNRSFSGTYRDEE